MAINLISKLLEGYLLPCIVRDKRDISLTCVDLKLFTLIVIISGLACLCKLIPGDCLGFSVCEVPTVVAAIDAVIDQITVLIKLCEGALLKNNILANLMYLKFHQKKYFHL